MQVSLRYFTYMAILNLLTIQVTYTENIFIYFFLVTLFVVKRA